jgi:hypothetical protein
VEVYLAGADVTSGVVVTADNDTAGRLHGHFIDGCFIDGFRVTGGHHFHPGGSA